MESEPISRWLFMMPISYNRGAIIVKGMPTGFYDGYDKEIHEVFVYWCPQ